MGHESHVGTPTWLRLDTDELVRFRANPSKNVLLVTFAIGTTLLLAVGVLALLFEIAIPTARRLSAAVLIFIFVLTGVVYLLTRRLEYAVSTHRAYRAVGLLSKEVESVDLGDVTDVTVTQSGWQRRLNVGEVSLDCEDRVPLRFRYVEYPEWTGDRIRELIENDR